MAKFVYRNPHFSVGSKAFGGTQEKSLCQDEDHKPCIRAKRNASHLPDGWDDTKFIHWKKSWKHRVRKKKQWMPHIMSIAEWKWVHGISEWWKGKNYYVTSRFGKGDV